MEFLIPIFVNAVLPVAGTVVTGLVSWGLFELNKFVKTKTKNEVVNDAMEHISHTVETSVHELEQTLVPEAKEALKDGKLTSEEAMKIKEIAISKVRAQLPKKMEKAAQSAVNSLNGIIGAKVEKAVLNLKTKTPPVPYMPDPKPES